MISDRTYLYLTVFAGGMSTLAIEFVASRMLQTTYGTSNLVWANVIGLVLFFLTLGYFLGGRLADKYPTARVFYTLVTAAGFSGIFFLLLLSVLLRGAASAMAAVNVGALLGSLVAVFFTLAVPMTLLGCLSPFAIRLGVREVAEAGRISGRVYAVSTWGSMLGTYLPVLLVIPEAGSRAAAIIFGALLLLVGLGGLWRDGQRAGLAGTLVALLLVPVAWSWGQGPIKSYPGQLFETESAYNYVQVIRVEDCNYLLLNEGQAYHSYYCDGGRVPRISVWSIMLAAPYFNAPETIAVEAPPLSRMAVVGLAAGTIPKQFTHVFGPIAVDGIEIDPAIVQVSRDYFALDELNINVIVGDGRYELARREGTYDLITVDAYKVPYIPWHLTTQQFFEEVRRHLDDDGVVAVNVGRAPEDRRLVEAMTATMATVFPSIHAIDVPGSLNTILVATVQPTASANLLQNMERLAVAERGPGTNPLLPSVLRVAADNLVPAPASGVIFTDERAPLETIVDRLVLRYLLQEGPDGLPGIGE